MKEMVDMGTRFIGFCDEADSLRSNFLYVYSNISLLIAFDITLPFVQELCTLLRCTPRSLKRNSRPAKKLAVMLK
jgi:hypothetical protein